MGEITRTSLRRVVGATCGAGLALVGVVVALNEMLFHGFAALCSDGHPEYDPVACGPTWSAGLPSLVVAALGVALLAVSVRRTRRSRD
jgi:hypothetical protein